MVRGPAAWRVRNRRLPEVTIARVLGPVKSNSTMNANVAKSIFCGHFG